MHEKLEDIKGVIRNRNRGGTYNTMGKRKWRKRQTMIYKTLQIERKIEQQEPPQTPG